MATPSIESEQTLSLRLHEDHGIAMAASAFFDVQVDGTIVRRWLNTNDSGLVIRRKGDDHHSLARPILDDDELVLMAGTGFTQWLEGTHEIPAVMHGMRIPNELLTKGAHRHLRAWFGKMTLLPLYQRFLRGGVTFDAFTNLTTRHLQRSTDGIDDRELPTIGCAGGRRLVVSEGSCLFRVCTPRPEYANANVFPSCPNSCNYEYPSQAQVDRCSKKCQCTDISTKAGICWMTCASWLPEDECSLDRQYCKGTTMKCAALDEPVTAQPTHDPAEMPPKLTYHPITITPSPSPLTQGPSVTTTPPTTAVPVSPSPTSEVPSTPSPTTEVPSTPSPTPIRGQC